jgi:serine/threonine protein kinase
MTLATSGTCQDLVTDLWNSNLINHTELKLCHEFLQQPAATPQALADHLVGLNVLTRFQADEVLRGNASELTVWTYVLVDVVGSGSMGTVYKALSRTDKQYFAIKMLPRRSVANIPKTSRELKAFREFRHPAVVPIVHVGTAAERHYLVWPFAPGGETLESILGRHGRLTPKEAVHYGLQMAKALHVCHQQGLFHGLLKPSDFLVDANHRVSILDFGIGFLLTLGRKESMLDTMTSSASLARALDYAAPESVVDSTKRTPLSDQYSLGCVFYHGLTGQPPFPTPSEVKKMIAHQHEAPVPVRDLNPGVPARLAGAVERMMRKAPEERFASLDEVVACLKALLTPSAQGQYPKPGLSGNGTVFLPPEAAPVPAADAAPAPRPSAPPAAPPAATPALPVATPVAAASAAVARPAPLFWVGVSASALAALVALFWLAWR